MDSACPADSKTKSVTGTINKIQLMTPDEVHGEVISDVMSPFEWNYSDTDVLSGDDDVKNIAKITCSKDRVDRPYSSLLSFSVLRWMLMSASVLLELMFKCCWLIAIVFFTMNTFSTFHRCSIETDVNVIDYAKISVVGSDAPIQLFSSSNVKVHAKFKINDVILEGLLDTGADMSVVDPSVVESLGLEVTPVEGVIRSFHPDLSSKRIGFVTVDIRHGSKTVRDCRLEVHHNTSGFICGTDLLCQFGIGLYGVSTEDPSDCDDQSVLQTNSQTVVSDSSNDEDWTAMQENSWWNEDRVCDADVNTIDEMTESAFQENLMIPSGSFCTDPSAEVPLDTGNANPIYRSQYNVPRLYKQQVTDQVESWYEEGIIVKAPGDTRWNSPLLPVRKKDGSGNFTKCRVCLDPRPLNALISDFDYAVPRIREMFDRLSGFKFASALDLKSSYNQFPLAVDDRIKTSFTWDCKFGRKFMFAGAPFGIKPLTQRFQATMEKILEPVSKFVLVYVDDIIIFSNGSIEDHAQKVSSVLKLLSSHNLRVNRDKCHLGFKRLRFLGHLLSGTQRTPDPRKLANLSGFTRPKTGKQIMAYLGFVNYLREYIPLYSKTASPLEKLRKTKVITDDDWSPECEAAFTQFRSVLCSAPVFSFPKDNVMFIVATDA
jgi:hypothetical protein